MSITTVFQNKHFIVIDKPAGTLSVPSRIGDKDPRPVIGKILQDELQTKIFPVHRLDEEVSGLLIYALNADAHRAANVWFEKHEILKTYAALSIEVPALDHDKYSHQVTWQCKLMRGKKRAYEAEFGKPSKTLANLIGHNNKKYSIWNLSPLTGRSHQLRYEMMRHGFPIIGDSLYGSTLESDIRDGIALRSFRLDFSNCNQREKYELPSKIQLELGDQFTPIV